MLEAIFITETRIVDELNANHTNTSITCRVDFRPFIYIEVNAIYQNHGKQRSFPPQSLKYNNTNILQAKLDEAIYLRCFMNYYNHFHKMK